MGASCSRDWTTPPQRSREEADDAGEARKRMWRGHVEPSPSSNRKDQFEPGFFTIWAICRTLDYEMGELLDTLDPNEVRTDD